MACVLNRLYGLRVPRHNPFVPLQKRNCAVEQPDAAKNKEQATEHPEPVRAALPADPVCWHPEEKEHRRKERQFWGASIGLSFLALLIAGVSFVFAYRAWLAGEKQAQAAVEQVRVAHESLIASDRPWVKLVNVKPSFVLISEGGAVIAVVLTVKNIGHSPAEDVYAAGKAFADISLNGVRHEAESICKENLPPSLNFLKSVVFPNEAGKINEGDFIINRRDVQKARTDYINSQPEFLHKQMADNPLYGVFTVVGCITYKIAGSTKRGETAFSFNVAKHVPGYSRLEGGFNMDKPANISSADMFLTPITWDLFAQ